MGAGGRLLCFLEGDVVASAGVLRSEGVDLEDVVLDRVGARAECGQLRFLGELIGV